MTKRFDLIIVGAGPGGYEAAIRARQLKLKTAVVERGQLGGVCLNVGCIPTKALLKSAEHYHFLKNEAASMGFKFNNLEVNFAKIIKKSRVTAKKLSKGVEYLFRKREVVRVVGTARFITKDRLEVIDNDGNKIDELISPNIIIATGCRPREIPGMGFDHQRIIDSTDAMTLKEIPSSMAIIGAGAIGVEFGHLYHTFGAKVTIVEMLDSILPIEDNDVSRELERIFKRRKMSILTGTQVNRIKNVGDSVEVTVETPEGDRLIVADVALVAVGVQPNTENIGLEDIGVTLDRGYINVDHEYMTNVPGVYAVGDVNGPPWLAHVASREGINCVERIAGLNPQDIDYQSIPGCTYCQPQVASVGLTEVKANEAGYKLNIGRFPIRANGKSVATNKTDGFVKVIFDKFGDRKLLGAHIISSDATEIIAELGMAKGLGATARSILQVTHAHPTQAEAIKEAVADALGEAINF
ncbi:MAG: dihydrolipoyl dehydrogenase [Candidatus Cloacimonetes bacterium 4572_55]|nr:MAG: dihydrolipoyl dehydrogenase [Candidatus Cloacimonetes bacterium 4572_55]